MALMRGLTRNGPASYLMVFEQADGTEVQFQFQVTTEPIPVVVWSDDFEQVVGTLSPPAPELLDLVLRFHRACDTEVSLQLP